MWSFRGTPLGSFLDQSIDSRFPLLHLVFAFTAQGKEFKIVIAFPPNLQWEMCGDARGCKQVVRIKAG